MLTSNNNPSDADLIDLCLGNIDYKLYFSDYIKKGIELELLSPLMADFDLEKLAKAIDPTRDKLFSYLSIQTLYDRYFLHKEGLRFELPQLFFMRVAMGLALEEKNKNDKAIEFYSLISSMDYMCATPHYLTAELKDLSYLAALSVPLKTI